MVLERYLSKLKEQQLEFAKAALSQPNGRDGFSYGHASGYYQGLLAAESLLSQVIEEDNENERKRK